MNIKSAASCPPFGAVVRFWMRPEPPPVEEASSHGYVPEKSMGKLKVRSRSDARGGGHGDRAVVTIAHSRVRRMREHKSAYHQKRAESKNEVFLHHEIFWLVNHRSVKNAQAERTEKDSLTQPIPLF